MSIFAIIMISLLGFVLVALGFFILVAVSSFSFSLSGKSLAKKFAKNNTIINSEKYKIDHTWWDKHPQQEFSITAEDGITLYAHFVEGEDKDKLAILVHGYGGYYKDLNSQANIFLRRGFSVLAVECRAHGKSGGKTVGMGWQDRLDIKAWIDFMLQRNANYQIVLFGQSMGATAVCNTLGLTLPPQVKCAISDCAFDNIYRQFYFVSKGSLKLLAKPTLNILYIYLKRAKNFDIKQADTCAMLKRSTVPVLFIHGKADQFVPVEMCYRLSGSVPEERRSVLLVEGAGHIESFGVDNAGYTKAVNSFLRKNNL